MKKSRLSFKSVGSRMFCLWVTIEEALVPHDCQDVFQRLAGEPGDSLSRSLKGILSKVIPNYLCAIRSVARLPARPASCGWRDPVTRGTGMPG